MNEIFKKRIMGMETEIFPLDRLLPLETVNIIFEGKYQRLREGYFAIFITTSLKDINNKKHYLVFPTSPNNDTYITYKLEGSEKFGAYKFAIA